MIATALAGQEDSDPTKASVGVKPSGAETHPRWHHRNRSHETNTTHHQPDPQSRIVYDPPDTLRLPWPSWLASPPADALGTLVKSTGGRVDATTQGRRSQNFERTRPGRRGERSVEVVKVVAGQLDVAGGGVLPNVGRCPGAWDGGDPVVLKHPG